MRLRAAAAASLAVLVVGCAANRPYRAPAGVSAPAREYPPGAAGQATAGVATATTDSVESGPPTRPSAPGPRWQPANEEPAVVAVTPPAPTPTRPPQRPAVPSAATIDRDADAERAVREGRIGAQVQRIRDEQIRLAANPGVCHDVCFAAGSICLAAQEVCRLAGDDDPRCGRARTACTDAGRQRDGSCPACPPAR